jgi:hypothetical protein
MKSTYEHLLEWLIELNKENRKRFEREFLSVPLLDFVFEFGTVRVDIGRAVGKTQFIKDHATNNDLILTFGHQQASIFEKGTKSLVFSNIDEMFEKLRGTSKVFETIYIDEPRLTFRNNDMRLVLSKLIYNNEQTIVVLGK